LSADLVTIGVVGAGTMGAGIAQLALEAGHEVLLHDVDEAAIERGRAKIRDGLARRAARLDLDADTIDDWVEGRYERLRDGHSLDALGAEADVVIEAALEDLELKRTVFRALDGAAAPDAILATNTSALSIAAIADVTARPERVLGLHFFNPAPVMRLVEVVSGPATSPSVAGRAAVLVASWGREPVACVDSPGFIVNRVNRPFTLEALRIRETGRASVADIDREVSSAGYPLGPFLYMDLVGIDVNLAAARGVWRGSAAEDSAVADPGEARRRAARGKSGHGFYAGDGIRGSVDAGVPDAPGTTAPNVAERRARGDRRGMAGARRRDATERDIDTAMRLRAATASGPRTDSGARRPCAWRPSTRSRCQGRFEMPPSKQPRPPPVAAMKPPSRPVACDGARCRMHVGVPVHHPNRHPPARTARALPSAARLTVP
jgi:3-hydroxybutyryl-CoA dehydrogenase